MVWKPGESGNPDGAKRVKLFLGALNRAIAQDSGDRLRKAAEGLLDAASEKQPWALQMLADRLDGKAAQRIIGAGEDGEHTIIHKIEEVIVDPQH